MICIAPNTTQHCSNDGRGTDTRRWPAIRLADSSTAECIGYRRIEFASPLTFPERGTATDDPCPRIPASPAVEFIRRRSEGRKVRDKRRLSHICLVTSYHPVISSGKEMMGNT